MLQREESRHDFAFIAGVIIGAISGALATLALTPMSGAQTREKIRERANQTNLAPIRERASSVASSAASSAQQFVATGREKASGLAARAPELAARSPLPIGRRSAEDAVAAEWPSSIGAAERTPHATEPAEGRADTGGDRASAGMPHATEPAEGRADIAQPEADKPVGS